MGKLSTRMKVFSQAGLKSQSHPGEGAANLEPQSTPCEGTPDLRSQSNQREGAANLATMSPDFHLRKTRKSVLNQFRKEEETSLTADSYGSSLPKSLRQWASQIEAMSSNAQQSVQKEHQQVAEAMERNNSFICHWEEKMNKLDCSRIIARMTKMEKEFDDKIKRIEEEQQKIMANIEKFEHTFEEFNLPLEKLVVPCEEDDGQMRKKFRKILSKISQ